MVKSFNAGWVHFGNSGTEKFHGVDKRSSGSHRSSSNKENGRKDLSMFPAISIGYNRTCVLRCSAFLLCFAFLRVHK
jgi:hypothetical protein